MMMMCDKEELQEDLEELQEDLEELQEDLDDRDGPSGALFPGATTEHPPARFLARAVPGIDGKEDKVRYFK